VITAAFAFTEGSATVAADQPVAPMFVRARLPVSDDPFVEYPT